MTASTLPAAIDFPTLPKGYVWSVTDYLGYPDGDPVDPATRKGERVLVAIHHDYRFGFIHFTIRVGRVLAYVLSSQASEEHVQQRVDSIWESFQRRLASSPA